jgi:hypothetical protein
VRAEPPNGKEKVRPAFATQPVRLDVDYEFYVNARGRMVNMHAYSKTGGRWAERAIADSIRALKCPPVPPQVFKELEQKPPLKIYAPCQPLPAFELVPKRNTAGYLGVSPWGTYQSIDCINPWSGLQCALARGP